jgi:dihydrofolate synthase / folylpolyglutamate synthase
VTLDALTSRLFARTTGGIRWGLETTRTLLAGVGDQHRQFRSLHIGGTNGKGSVAALCHAALAVRGGERVGLYTSPHLVSFAERIRIGGRPAPAALVESGAERLMPGIERSGASFFEATTAIAFLCFAEAGVEMAVVEVGLGGRLDATNVLLPDAVAITNVARDHTEYLGEGIAQIAREKAGILKPGVPAVTGARDPEALAVLRSEAAARGTPLLELPDLASATGLETDVGGTAFRLRSARWGERELRVALAGAHQAENAMLAAELLGLLPQERRPGWEEVERGFGSVRWPGRLQLERIRGTSWLLDVAHNPAGVAVLAAALDRLELPRPLVLLVGILGDKEWREMLPPLLRRSDAVVVTVPPSAPERRRWRPDEVARWCAREQGARARAIPDFEAVLRRAETLAPHGTVLVTGSFHTVGDAMALLGVAAT